MRTAKSFTLRFAVIAMLTTSVFAAGRDEAKRVIHDRQPSLIQRIIDKIHQILTDDAIVPKPTAVTTTPTTNR